MASQQAEVVHEGCENPLHGPEHGAEAQVEQHQEEQRGPEGAGREKSHHLREGDERQACSLNALRSNRKGGKAEGKKYVITTLPATVCDVNESCKILRIPPNASR